MVDSITKNIYKSLFSKIKTGNPIFDTIFSTIVITSISYTVKLCYETSYSYSYGQNPILSLSSFNIIDNLKDFFYKKNTIIMTARKCTSLNGWNSNLNVNSIFGNHFKAVWEEIISNIDNNPTIYEIKDYLNISEPKNKNYDIENGKIENNNDNDNNNFIVSQKKPFIFNKALQIYAIANISSEESKGEKEKSASKIDNVEIILYSYKSSLKTIKNFIDDLSNKYLENIEKKRNNKQFIYTLIKTKYEDSKSECWKESIFDTTRCFDNMFFDQKQNTIQKIDFFLNNKDWYYQKGIPYTIGFGLHGPPGTGKTSFIKSLAKYTNRHVIILSLKLIKTRRQLQEFFYEDRYNNNNKKRSIGFDNKIMVIEDIDAQGDIVLDRLKKGTAQKRTRKPMKNSAANINDVLQSLVEIEKEKEFENDKKLMTNVVKINFDDEPITLDDILNLWDGIEETTGRILVISSNHYFDLDPALTRPGRIDVSIEMNNASYEMIVDLYNHLYDKSLVQDKVLNIKDFKKVKPYFYSPADIINFYLMYKNDEKAFLNRLLLNKK